MLLAIREIPTDIWNMANDFRLPNLFEVVSKTDFIAVIWGYQVLRAKKHSLICLQKIFRCGADYTK